MEQFSFKPKKYFSYPILENNFQKFDYGLGITFIQNLDKFGYLGAGVYTNQFEDYDFNFSYANKYNSCNYGFGVYQRHGEGDSEYNYDLYAKFGYKIQDHTFDISLRGKDIIDEDFSLQKHVDKCLSYQFEIDDYLFGAGLIFQPNGHTNGGVNVNYRYADAFFGFGVNVENGKINGGASVMMQNDIYGYGAQIDTSNIGLKANYKYRNQNLSVETRYNFRNTENEVQNLPKVGVSWSMDF